MCAPAALSNSENSSGAGKKYFLPAPQCSDHGTADHQSVVTPSRITVGHRPSVRGRASPGSGGADALVTTNEASQGVWWPLT